MGYTSFDKFVAWCRFRAALPHVRPGARVCDIGCGLDAAFLRWAAGRIRWGVGLDDQLARNQSPVVFADIRRPLPLRSATFDHALMLAVLEHLQQPEATLREAYRVLAPGGSLIMTWPSSAVDPLLHALHRIGVVSDEMESQEHQRRLPLPQLTALLRQIGFNEFRHRTFEFGLNNLLVAHKS